MIIIVIYIYIYIYIFVFKDCSIFIYPTGCDTVSIFVAESNNINKP